MNITSYVWKDKRLINDKNALQLETKMVDMSEDQLQMIYTHCKNMLYNTNPKQLGRMIIADEISIQLDKCGAELALRWFKTLKDEETDQFLYNNESLLIDLKSWIKELSPEQQEETLKIGDFIQVPIEFKNVSVNSLIDACLDTLGLFNHSKITKSFICEKIGIYFTRNELQEIDKELVNNGIDANKIGIRIKINNHVLFPLGLNNTVVKINPKGLNKKEFEDMINMKKYRGHKSCKYSELSSSQLKTLRSKVLFLLEERVLYQAQGWKDLMGQIEEVAKYKNIKLE